MSILFNIIFILILIDTSFFIFNKLSTRLRRKKSQELVINKDRVRSQLLHKISELNEQLEKYKSNYVSKTDYDELVHKYNLLLNQYRVLSNKNKFLQNRIKKLKDKLY